ncbi:MAG: hypothetical protein AB7I33_05345 [Gemmatimonadales bacterium]
MSPHRRRVSTRAAVVLIAAALPAAAQAQSRPLFEASVWGVHSRFADASPSGTGGKDAGTGVRTVELAMWPTANLRLFGRYDNSLSLDNLTLLRTDRRVPTWSGGLLFNWGGRFTTVFEGGRRDLPGGIGQTLLSAEQLVYLPGGAALKAGGQAAPREDNRTEWQLHGGVNLPVATRFRLEPVVFYAQSGLAGESQWRALVAGEFQAGGASLGAGLAGGHNRSADGAFTGAVWDAYGRLSLAIGGLNRAHVMVRHERVEGASPLTSIGLGLSVVVPRP